VFCLIHDVVAVTSHFLVVCECIAGGGVFLYRDSKCIVGVLIHSRHVEMVAVIHEGCSVPDRDSALSCFLLVELLVAFADSISPQRPEIDASTVSCLKDMPVVWIWCVVRLGNKRIRIQIYIRLQQILGKIWDPGV